MKPDPEVISACDRLDDFIRKCEHLDWLILTKRPERILDCLPPDWANGYANVWLGTTVGALSSLRRIPLLTSVPAKIRFVSAEPLLEARAAHQLPGGTQHGDL